MINIIKGNKTKVYDQNRNTLRNKINENTNVKKICSILIK